MNSEHSDTSDNDPTILTSSESSGSLSNSLSEGLTSPRSKRDMFETQSVIKTRVDVSKVILKVPKKYKRKSFVFMNKTSKDLNAEYSRIMEQYNISI
jgi:hypothetical protein